MTHDYTRHGTVTLFAALSALEGKLIARTETRHTQGPSGMIVSRQLRVRRLVGCVN